MPLTPAERAKRYRENLKKDKNKYQEYLNKEHERYIRRRERGDYDISNKSVRHQNLIKRKWRKDKREQRVKKAGINKGIEFLILNSPTTSPVRENDPLEIQDEQPAPIIPQAMSGRKRKRKDRAKAYRTIDNVEKSVRKYKTLWETCRKKLHRITKKRQLKVSEKKMKVKMVKHAMSKSSKKPKVTGFAKKVYNETGHSVTCNIERRKRVKHFLEDDCNSSQAPGKKDTVTKHKKKMQKRYLNDTLLNLHKKYCKTYPSYTVSYATFCRFRPFWIVQKKVDGRETCPCKLHENVKLRFEKLARMSVFKEK